MGKPTGFLDFPRRGPSTRPVELRVKDWREVYEAQSDEEISEQSARCMDCGIPFCMQGCPLGNRIPVFNDDVFRGEWSHAVSQLIATNNFPEFTGRLCPAPCESACVVGLNDGAVTIERIEYETIEHAFHLGLPVSHTSRIDTNRRVAVVGSGPAGLAAAAQLRVAGHGVNVFERSDDIGGLLRYGIPEFKLEKAILDRRLAVMRSSGIKFFPGVTIGAGGTPLTDLQRNHDAVILAIGATRPRLLTVPGSDLVGIMPAMTYLSAANRAVRDGTASPIDAKELDVVILGGGDTGADCLGTAHRQGARSVTQIEILPRPPDDRPPHEPWPLMARLFKVSTAHAEGGERLFSTETISFAGTHQVAQLHLRLPDGSTENLPADLVLIAAGFLGPELDDLDLASPTFLTERDTLRVNEKWQLSETLGSTPVFACGDAVRGQSLIVWAIAEGRSAAAAVDAHLQGTSHLPAPLTPYATSW